MTVTTSGQSIQVNASSSPPPTYTCYRPRCVARPTPEGPQLMCIGEAYTSSTPCQPGVNDTPENACKNFTCP